MRAIVVTVLVISSAALAGGPQEPGDLPPPRPEIARDEATVAPPPVPAFELPAVEPGFHRPRELRVHGRAQLGAEIVVKGYVTAIYDCAEALALAHPRASHAELLQIIDRRRIRCRLLRSESAHPAFPPARRHDSRPVRQDPVPPRAINRSVPEGARAATASVGAAGQ